MKENLFQMAELEALLGDYVDNFDIDGIIADATAVDENGNRYWTAVGAELNMILAKHDNSLTKRIVYNVYFDKMMLVEYDERYIDVLEDESGNRYRAEEFDTETEAVKYMHDNMGTLRYEVIRTKRGLDTILYDTACVEREVDLLDDDGEVYDVIDVTTVAYEEGITEELRELARRSERSYHAFLDYKQDSYCVVTELLDA